MSHFVPTTKKPGLLPCLDSPEGVRDGDTLFWGVRPVRPYRVRLVLVIEDSV